MVSLYLHISYLKISNYHSDSVSSWRWDSESLINKKINLKRVVECKSIVLFPFPTILSMEAICLSSFLKPSRIVEDIVQWTIHLLYWGTVPLQLQISAFVSGTFPHAFCSPLWLTLPDPFTAIMFWRSEYIYATILLKFLLTLNVWCLKGGNTTIQKWLSYPSGNSFSHLSDRFHKHNAVEEIIELYFNGH